MVKKPLAGLLVLLALHAAAPAHAVFLRGEMDVIEAEPLFDSEYFLDLLSFSPPLEWEWDWDAAIATRPAAAYRINGASLDCCSLLLQQEASLRRRLNDWLDLRYDLRQSADKDLDDFHQWLALEAGPWRGFSAGVFGEPTLAKQDSDIGYLVRLSPLEGVSVYGSRNAVDWNMNSRGSGVERYDKKPLTYEAGAEAWTPWGLLRPRVELDTSLVRADPSLNRRYSYRRNLSELRWDLPLGDGRRGFSFRYRHELKQEGLRFDPDPTSRSLEHSRVTHSARAAALAPAGALATVEAGGEALWRSARSAVPGAVASRADYRRWELHPYARWRRKVGDRSVGEVAAFLSVGEMRQTFATAASLYAKPVEAKLGLGWDFLYSGNGRIGLYSAFDLDDLGRHVWDGGNIRAQLQF